MYTYNGKAVYYMYCMLCRIVLYMLFLAVFGCVEILAGLDNGFCVRVCLMVKEFLTFLFLMILGDIQIYFE